MRAGDPAVFEQLFDQYYDRLVVFAARYLDSYDDAADLVQGFFVEFYERRAIMYLRNLNAFFFQSVRNKCLNELKHRAVVRKHEEDVLATEDESEEDDLDDEGATEIAMKVAAILKKLAPQCRRIFEMSRLEGRSNDEIAAELNISKRTVETQISNALKALRKIE